MKKILFLLIPFSLICCNKKEVIEKYENGIISHRYFLNNKLINGTFEEFYKNSNPKAVHIYENGVKRDSSIYYYENNKGAIKVIKYWKNDIAIYQKDFFENGKLMREGNLLRDNFRIGKWYIYTKENYKSEIIEYLNIKGKSYANQIWKLNSKGDTITGGVHYELIIKDTVDYNEPFKLHLFLKQRLLMDSESSVYIPSDGNVSNEDFSNEDKIKWKKIDNVSKWHKDFPDRKHDVIFSLWPEKKGRDTLRGFIVENEIIKGNSYDSITRITYFNIPFFVK